MTDEKPAPFSRKLEAEKRPLLERPWSPEDRAIEVAKDGVLKRVEPLRIGYLRLTQRQQALVLVAGGGLLVAAMWALLVFAPELVQQIAANGRTGVPGMVVGVVGPWLLCYGGLRMTVPEIEAPPQGARFGGVLTEARDTGRWKMQLVAIMAALVHLVLYASFV